LAHESILSLCAVPLSFKGVKGETAQSLNVINGVHGVEPGDVLFEPLCAAGLWICLGFHHNALFRRMSAQNRVPTGLTRHSRRFASGAIGRRPAPEVLARRVASSQSPTMASSDQDHNEIGTDPQPAGGSCPGAQVGRCAEWRAGHGAGAPGAS
jgi:hypothetical protein